MTTINNQAAVPVATEPSANGPLVASSQGYSQSSRGLAQLAAGYFSVEERSFSGWLDYMRRYAGELNFIDEASQSVNGTWLSALPDAGQSLALQSLLAGETVSEEIKALAARPDIAGLLAFFTMMQYPLEQFNRFTDLHQQHYYRDVLGFKTRAPVADKSHLVIALQDDVPSMTLLKGTKFSGGEDAAGEPLIYQTKSNALINHARVDKVLSLSRHRNSGNMLLTTCQDSSQDIEMPPNGVLTFGETSLEQADIQCSPELGFTLASPELYLSGGLRTLTLSFNVKEGVSLPPFDISEYFDLAISGIEGMLPLTSQTPFCHIQTSDRQVVIVLESLFPEVGIYQDESLTPEQQAVLPQEPFISFVLKSQMYAGSYGDQENALLSQLRAGVFSHIDLAVAVEGVGGIIANNSNGQLDTSEPFTPFTREPRIASVFEFTHPELLVKQVEQAQLSFSWLDRPANWQQHYQAYVDYRRQQAGQTGDEGLTWQAGNVNVGHSDILQQVDEDLSLFSEDGPVNNIDRHQLTFIKEAQANQHPYQGLPFTENRAREWPKWFSLTLGNNDFGHDDYSRVVQYTSFLNMEIYNQVAASGKTEGAVPMEVREPYTPTLDSLQLNYQSKATFTLEQAGGRHKLQYIHPLGRPVMQSRDSDSITLLPRLDALGCLYIGLSGVVAPGQARLYFQLDPVDGSNIGDNPKVDWHYLSDSGWTFFDSSNPGSARIVEDSTYKLLDSGVVTFELPELEIGENFTGDSRFWIRLSISEQAVTSGAFALYSRIRNVYAQGVAVELVGLDNDPSHFTQPLAAESITALVTPDPGIGEVLQPYPSFGGKSAEPASELAIRASERLRHKNRAMTAWDYEHLVLAQFPELFLVRCFANKAKQGSEPLTSEEQAAAQVAAQVAVMVVPVNHNPDILQPKVPLYLKRRIQDYVEQVAPLGVSSKVYDPVYEEVELELFAKISSDYDIESVEGQLNQIIVDYMTPWNGADGSNAALAKEIYLTELAIVLERHVAVEKIYVMRARQNLSGGEMLTYGAKDEDDNRVEPSQSGAILVPKAKHKISLFNTDVDLFEGVGKWRLELDFAVS